MRSHNVLNPCPAFMNGVSLMNALLEKLPQVRTKRDGLVDGGIRSALVDSEADDLLVLVVGREGGPRGPEAVSYTHLTLPTIYSE